MFSTSEEIYSVVKSFEDRTMTKSEWNHRTHLVVGMYYCRTLPFTVAKNVLRDGIYWLNDKHGTPNTDDSGYHETLTIFWLKRIWNFLDSQTSGASLVSLANEVIERFGDPELPLRYYTHEQLFSAAARRDYLPPNIRKTQSIHLSITHCILKPLL